MCPKVLRERRPIGSRKRGEKGGDKKEEKKEKKAAPSRVAVLID